jgi:hypothetical protein
MNETLSITTILTKTTFVTASVVSLIFDSTCFVLGLPLGIFIRDHVLFKCHFEAFVALSISSRIFCRNQTIWFAKLDPLVLTDLLRCFFFWIVSYIVAFFFTSKATSLSSRELCLVIFLVGTFGWEVSQCWALKAFDMIFLLNFGLINLLIRCIQVDLRQLGICDGWSLPKLLHYVTTVILIWLHMIFAFQST